MSTQIISHRKLMAESWLHLESVAKAGSEFEQHVVRRVVEQPLRWYRWENRHSSLMSTVSKERSKRQLVALRRLAFRMIHSKALFNYLRSDQQAHVQCRTLMHMFRPNLTRTQALIQEHETFLFCNCSQFCAQHLGTALMTDWSFQDPMIQYELAYNEYFESFCRCALAGESDSATQAERALLPLLKHELNRQRLMIMGGPSMTPAMLRELRMRQPTGDTVRLSSLPRRH